MRRLTLILSDLYLPEEAGAGEIGRGAGTEYLPLPELERLLRFARQTIPIDDWRKLLAGQVGCASLASVAPAHFAARGQVPAGRVHSSWFATPVHLEARLDHVRLDQHGLLRLQVGERLAWCEEFARSFGPELALHDAGARGFFLSGLESQPVSSTDPARMLGADIASSLARGDGAAPLRRLSAEIDMWLHGAALNRERERARAPRISSLWLWGGTRAADDVTEVAPDTQRAYAGDDPWLAALARAQTGAAPWPAPEGLCAFKPAPRHGIVELTPLSESHDGLARLDANWLGPARAALAAGTLEQVEIVANDGYFITQRHDSWRFWRRPRHWMELLRRPRVAAQA